MPAVLNRQLDRILNHIAAARAGRHVSCILLGREDILQNRTELDLAHDAARFHIREHFFQVAHALRERLHLAKALVNLLQALVDQLERLVHAVGQGLLQFFVDNLTHVVQLFVVVRLHGAQVLVDCNADILQILCRFGGKSVQPPLELAKLVGHAGHTSGKAFVHRGQLAELRLAAFAEVLADQRAQRRN